MTTSPATIGVGIPTRNQANTILDTLRSVYAQTHLPQDVLVCDDGGTDATPELVAQFRVALPPERQRSLRYVRHTTPLGIGGNFDYAVRATHGDYCVKVDSDDILEPDFVARLAALLDANPQAGWAHCNIRNIAPDGSPIGLAHNRKRHGFTAAPSAFRAYLRHNDTCHCVMIRRTAYETAGGYRPTMRTCEDWLLWLEMCIAGFGNVYTHAALARMRKYQDRQDLMARRRLDFVDSAAQMLAIVENALTPEMAETLGVRAPRAMATLRAHVSAHVRFAVLHTDDVIVRQRLLSAITEFSPTWRNHLWCAADRVLPMAWMRVPPRASGYGRDVARRLVRLVRGA